MLISILKILWNIFFYMICFALPVVGLSIYLKIDLLNFIGLKKTSTGESVDIAEPVADEEQLSDEIEALTIEELRCGDDLSLAYRSVDRVPSHIAYAPGVSTIKKVDLTECGISSLETLVLDKNNLDSLETCPLLPNLRTLWANNNNISDLGIFLTDVANKCPRLTYLSLMRNPIVPDLEDVEMDIDEYDMMGGDDVLDLGNGAWTDPGTPTKAYLQESLRVSREMQAKKKQYRLAVLNCLPKLRLLDGEVVTAEEIAESKVQGAVGNLLDSRLDRGEDEHWRWPPGFTPPAAWLRDSVKMGLIKAVQDEMDSSGEDFREMARRTCWDVNKRTISRYLEASLWQKELNSVPVAQAILTTIKWRLTYPIPFKDKHLLSTGLSSGAFVLHGHSKNGRPILIIRPARDLKKDHAVNAKCLIYSIERIIQSLRPDLQEYIMIIDCTGVGYSDVAPVNVTKEMAGILGKHMPRRLGQVYLLNLSYIVTWIFDMVSFYLNEVTKKKFRFISGGRDEMRRVMSEQIDVKVLPKEYGGQSEIKFSVHEYLAADPYLSSDPLVTPRLYS